MKMTSDKGKKFITREEGERLSAYRDAVGVWTIGVGHTGWVDGHPVKEGMKITAEQSQAILSMDLHHAEHAINENVVVPLQQHQFDALVSLAFNIGVGAFRRSTLLKLLNAEDYLGAGKQFLRWKNAGGRPILLGRRRREKRLFEEGRYV